jgi:hypothetical protein
LMSTPEEQVQTQEVQDVQERRQVSGRQLALILGGAVLLILLLWFLFLRGGDEENTSAAPDTIPPATTPAPEETEGNGGEGAGKPGGGPVETFDVFAPKDPFDPLLSEDSGEGTTAGGTTTTDTTDDGGTTTTTTTDTSGGTDTDGDGVIDTGTGSGTGPSGGASGSSDVRGGHSVELVATLDGGRGQVRIDETVYTVDESERFADNFELVSVSADCATMLFGDDQFTLCEGEEILK